MQKVLVVDDEPLIADTLVVLLNQAGFDGTATYSGADAVEMASRLRPDVVISDVIMSDMNGVEAAIEIQKTLPSCRILLLSGQLVASEQLRQATAAGYEFELLAKPIDPEDIVAKLR